MGRRDARRVYVVVTGGAAAGYPDVIEHRAAPAERRMAGVALQVGDDVRGPLALRLHAVVAGRAAAAHLGVVEVDRRVPGDGRMAAGALVGREDVVGGLGGGAHGGADAVTGAAVLRGALEYGVGVTGLAGQVAVLADELEAGRQMVEVVADRRGKSLRQQPEEQQRRERAYTPAPALPPVLPDVHVVLLVAREAILLELHFVRWPQVAGLAGELAVRTGEGKSGLLAVVELPHFPAVRGVAASAVLAQIALMHVVLAMAVDTLLADVAVLAGQMALLARNRDVQTHQRKAREVVIEAHAGAPASRRVALIAFLAELAGVHVVRPVAADAFGGQLLRRHARGMAGMTRDLLVTADEGPLGVARMVKARGLPLLVAMTGAAVLAEAAGVRVLRLVTAGALARQLVLEIARAVAVVAGDQ